MESVTLDQMKSVSLMNRIDTKFVTSVPILMKILDDACSARYMVCEISGSRLLRYTSVYYDTDDLEMFRIHRNGKKTRQKIRIRTYHINNVTYLEIKNRKNTGRTKKKRILLPEGGRDSFMSDKETMEFFERHSRYPADWIAPETSTDFHRITLTDKDLTERITIDVDLNFVNHRNGEAARIDNLVIIEVKQDGRNVSQMSRILLKHRVFPYRVSKYCLSVISTEPDVLPGRYKEKLRYIHKITEHK